MLKSELKNLKNRKLFTPSLGHTTITITTTLDIYSHVTDAAKKEAVSKLTNNLDLKKTTSHYSVAVQLQ